MKAPRRPRPRKTSAPNWSAHGWPRPEFRLPDLDVLEALSRVDGDQDDPEPAEQREFDLGGTK